MPHLAPLVASCFARAPRLSRGRRRAPTPPTPTQPTATAHHRHRHRPPAPHRPMPSSPLRRHLYLMPSPSHRVQVKWFSTTSRVPRHCARNSPRTKNGSGAYPPISCGSSTTTCNNADRNFLGIYKLRTYSISGTGTCVCSEA